MGNRGAERLRPGECASGKVGTFRQGLVAGTGVPRVDRAALLATYGHPAGLERLQYRSGYRRARAGAATRIVSRWTEEIRRGPASVSREMDGKTARQDPAAQPSQGACPADRRAVPALYRGGTGRHGECAGARAQTSRQETGRSGMAGRAG